MSFLLWVVMVSAACGTELGFISTGTSPHPLHARGPERVEVFMTGRPVRPYVDMGIVESRQEGLSLDDEETVVGKMREYAGELGCDALVIFAGNDATVVSGGSGSTSSRTLKGYRGSCVVYTGPAPAPSPPPPPMAAANGCLPNATQLCFGPGGCRGGQRCNADGRSYTICDCGPTNAPSPPQNEVPAGALSSPFRR